MVTGYLTAILCVILVASFLARKARAKRIFLFLRKVHIPIGVLICIVVAVHFIMTIPVWKTRQITVVLSGIALGVLILLMAVFYLLYKKDRKKFRKIHQMGTILIVCLLITHIVTYYVDFFSYRDRVAAITLDGVTASGIKDGSYIGECNVGYIYAKVNVVVKGEKITKIELLQHENERGKRAEALTDEMVKAQTTNVDAISGASNSSCVIKKATENALESAKR